MPSRKRAVTASEPPVQPLAIVPGERVPLHIFEPRYKELIGVAVAIKVIRPSAQSDATAAKDLEQRFKRELVLARQVESRNDMLGVLEAQLFEQAVKKKMIPTMMPVRAPYNASSFGRRIDPFNGQWAMHEGIDFIAEYGSPIVAAQSGLLNWNIVATGVLPFAAVDARCRPSDRFERAGGPLVEGVLPGDQLVVLVSPPVLEVVEHLETYPHVPRELTDADVERTIEDYARAARLAKRAGYDGVEIMGSEGYLINQFLAERVNRRDDAWGFVPPIAKGEFRQLVWWSLDEAHDEHG